MGRGINSRTDTAPLAVRSFIEELRSTEDPRNIGTLVSFYTVEWGGKPQNNEPEENMAIGWFDLNNLPPIAWKTHEKVLRDLVLEKGKI